MITKNMTSNICLAWATLAHLLAPITNCRPDPADHGPNSSHCSHMLLKCFASLIKTYLILFLTSGKVSRSLSQVVGQFITGLTGAEDVQPPIREYPSAAPTSSAPVACPVSKLLRKWDANKASSLQTEVAISSKHGSNLFYFFFNICMHKIISILVSPKTL